MEVSILRANRNYIYLVFGQQLSGHTGERAFYLHGYFGDVFYLCPKVFIQQVLIDGHKEWNLTKAYLEKQRGEKHVFIEIEQEKVDSDHYTLRDAVDVIHE
ncbi:hypothetical protein HMPREF1544_12310 [Mucor circinelloides 1006PhL]|uniref:Uncharacterized protein n=1 Tax=Mucor circinelloides f. circinelloides (strain 1006PhL) TaxID=1220926 RepID=S2ITQ1_MUCC1|nr:hypothetical protein HMPREF1544_12310 [Mucor circinelloides 1006PhL]